MNRKSDGMIVLNEKKFYDEIVQILAESNWQITSSFSSSVSVNYRDLSNLEVAV